MNKFTRTFLVIAFTLALPFTLLAQKPGFTKYKCMVQMTNYIGEEAYIVVSLINPKGAYEKTLYVMGPDKKWYRQIREWNSFYLKKPANISAITGASVAGGDRSVTTFEIENVKINAGYKLRFETSVEDKEYHVKDIEVPLTTQGLATKTEGKNYIRYVRFSAN